MTTAIVEYSKTEAGIADLRGRLANVVYDVTKPAEMDRARKDRRECVTLRTSLEELRVQLKAGVLEAEAARVLKEAVDKADAERAKTDAERREVERLQNELLDGAAMLRKFAERYGKRREFLPVTKAINAWLSREEAEQTTVRA